MIEATRTQLGQPLAFAASGFLPGKDPQVTSIRHRAKAAVHVVAARVALYVPAAIGPARWTRFSARTRVARALDLAGDHPAAAMHLVQSLLDRQNPSAGAWRAVAAVRERQGDLGAALDAIRQSTSCEDRDVNTLLAHRRLATRLREADEARRMLEMLAATPPRNTRELNRTVEALSSGGDLELTLTYQNLLREAKSTHAMNQQRLNELIDEFRLVVAHGEGRGAFLSERDRVLREHHRPLRVTTLALARVRAWNELAEFIATTPGGQLIGARGLREGFPAAEVTRAATSALSAGWASAASILSARALVAEPHSVRLKSTFDHARDQLTIARNGWQYPKPGSTPYDPSPTAAIAVLSQSLPMRSGGYATRSHGVLTSLAARGWEVEAVTRLGFPYDRWKAADTRTVATQDTIDGVVYRRLLHEGMRKYPQHPLSSYIQAFADGVVSAATDRRASLIHASSFYVAGMAGLTAARRLGLPFIYEMRGLEELMKVSRDPTFVDADRYRFLDQLETGVAREANAVFVITKALGHEMVRRGVDDRRLTVIPNGVHTERFQPRERDPELEAHLGLKGKTVIGYVGGLVDYEGLDVLLNAVAGLKNTRDDLHVLIVGDGANERVVHEQANRLRLGGTLTFTGRVPHEDVERYLSLIDIAPFPRLPLPVCELISPIKPFESMAMAKAVVVSDVAALAEIIADGKTGRLFRKGDSEDLRRVLEELLDDPVQRRELGRSAREWVVRERDWSAITAAVDAVYRELIDRHSRRLN